MRPLHPLAGLALLAVLVPAAAGAVHAAEPEEPSWSVEASLAWYFVLEQENFPQPTILANRGPLHLETRYNYEGLRTVSFLVGWNFEFGERVKLGLTPIAGCALGETGGPILGLELSLEWGPVGFSSQGEWMNDRLGGTGSFLYAWAELDVRPWEWLRVGMVVQRTRVFHTPREVMLGPLIGVTIWRLDASAYWLDPGGPGQFVVVALGASF